MNLDRIDSIASELSAHLLRSIVLPEGIRAWFSRPLSDRLRNLYKPVYVHEHAEAAQPPRHGGPLVLFGGYPVPDEGVVEVIHLVGGRDAKLAVLPLAAADQPQAGAEAKRLFTRFGMKKATLLGPVTPAQLNDPAWCAELSASDAVLICGNSASLGMALVQGTLCEQTLRTLHEAGKTVIGLGAGAAMLAQQFLTGTGMAYGLGFAVGVAVELDPSESRVHQLVRHLQAEGSPELLGVCTAPGAAVILREGDVRVIGEQQVSVVDAQEHARAAEPLGPFGARMHVLTDGYRFNLRSKRSFAPVKEPSKAVGG